MHKIIFGDSTGNQESVWVPLRLTCTKKLRTWQCHLFISPLKFGLLLRSQTIKWTATVKNTLSRQWQSILVGPTRTWTAWITSLVWQKLMKEPRENDRRCWFQNVFVGSPNPRLLSLTRNSWCSWADMFANKPLNGSEKKMIPAVWWALYKFYSNEKLVPTLN